MEVSPHLVQEWNEAKPGVFDYLIKSGTSAGLKRYIQQPPIRALPILNRRHELQWIMDTLNTSLDNGYD